MTERQGTFTIPTRLFLTEEQRARLERLVRDEGADLADVVSRIVADYLGDMPAPPPEPPMPAPERRSDIRQRRAELARLRARREAAGSAAPAWLNAYIADLEADIQRLERV